MVESDSLHVHIALLGLRSLDVAHYNAAICARPSVIPGFKLCGRDNASAASGTLQPVFYPCDCPAGMPFFLLRLCSGAGRAFAHAEDILSRSHTYLRYQPRA